MKRLVFAALALAIGAMSAAQAAPLPKVEIVTPAYTLACTPTAHGKQLTLQCVPSRTPGSRSRAFFETYRFGETIPRAILAQVAPLGNGGPSVGATDSTITVTGGYNVGVNLGNADTWTALQSFNGSSASSQAGAPTTVYGAYYGLGNGTTNSTAIAIGWQTGTSGWACVSSCTTSNSAQICLYGMSATGPLANCSFVDIAGVLNIGKLKITNSLNAGGNVVSNVAKLGTNTSCSGTSPVTSSTLNNVNCLVTAASSSAVLNFGTAYAARPICVVSDETTTTSEAKPTVTTTSVTVATPGASDVVDILCFGNGGV